MVNFWSRRGHCIEILTLWPKGSQPFYELDAPIVHRPLSLARDSDNLLQFIAYNLKRISVIRRAIIRSRPDIIISSLDKTNILVSLASIGCGIPLIVCEHNDPAESKIGGRGWELLRKLTYSRADALVVETNVERSFFGPGIRRRTSVIPNGVTLPAGSNAPPSRRKCNHKIIAVGRLANQKGFDLLLQAFSKVHPRFPQWSLTVWGDGPERGTLEELRDRLGLTASVQFPGRTQNPFKEMAESDLFVLSSRYEGFPNVLLEAMTCSLPVISFECSSGPGEIIRDQLDGILVPPRNVNALADAMAYLIDNPELRTQLGERAKEVVQRFGLEKVMGQWEELLVDILPNSAVLPSPSTASNNC